ncbi:MAG: hypothetical protein H0W46_06285 [Acidimicrobiia bacterium]|nr:hypothetical protein [Acidimicrobiia bacterium]
MDPADAVSAEVRRFAGFVSGDPAATPLDRSALSVASVLRSSVDADDALTMLDMIAAECPTPTFAGLRRHLYDDLGFHGDATHYHDPRNSFLDLVLARRTGLPILLAVVVMEVGRRIGVPVVGVNMPLHFLVRAGDDAEAFLDPFTGQALDAGGAQALLERVSAGSVPWTDRHLRPVPARLIVVRMLSNLQAGYQRRHDAVRGALVARLRATIPELAEESATAIRLGAVFN